ncbi:MAG: hypothetical protein ACJ8IK_09630 [Burkholderiaceae bacterium]
MGFEDPNKALALPAPLARLRPREWALIALGLATWAAIIAGGVWFVHQMTRSQAACGAPLEARSLQPKASPAAGPRNSLQLLTGTGKCPR